MGEIKILPTAPPYSVLFIPLVVYPSVMEINAL